MTPTTENPAVEAWVRRRLAERLDTPEYTRSPHDRQALAGVHFERQIMRVHALGPRPLAEMLGEIATATGQPAAVADRIEAYAALDAAVLRAVGADSFPPNVLEIVR